MLRHGKRQRGSPRGLAFRQTAGGVALWTMAVAGIGGWWATAQETRWQPVAGRTEVPKSPADPTAAKVYAVLDRNCAGCHQSGKTSLPAPAGAFGSILDLTTLASDETKVRPGAPDASPLYMQMQASPWHGQDPAKELQLTSGDLDVVRDWINTLKPQARCAERRQVGREDMSQAVRSYLDSAGTEARTSRFLSLAHLYNACASDAEMKAYRQAAAIAINSLSWGLRPVVLAPVDPAETVFRIDLTAMGWDEGRWNRLLAAYPYRAVDGIEAGDGTAAVRADWFAVAALSPPLYYELLGLPDRLSTLTASLRVDLTTDLAQNKARRIGLKSSNVARGSRLLQRSTFANGAFWITYEYAPTPGRPDLMETPAGPGSRGAARPDGSLVMFSLPSGYNAFFMANGEGNRINDLPLSVVRNDTHPGQRLTAGGRCLACHTQGPQSASDELKARVNGDTSVPRDIRDKVLALAASDEEVRAFIAADIGRVSGALAETAVVPGATLDGLDPVSALAHRYEQDVTLDVLAAELGESAQRLRDLAGTARGLAGDVVDRVVHGPVPRRNIEAASGSLAALLRPGVVAPIEPAAAQIDAASDEAPPRLVLKTGAASFKIGETLTITARAQESCYLTVINVDRNGRGTVVFPNDFEPNNFIEAGKEMRVPADGAPYVFRLREAGRETIVGICQTGSKVLPGIRHDFERQRFSELGDYKAFLARVNLAETEAQPTQIKGAAAEPKARRRGRAATAPGMTSAPAARGDVQMRAGAIVDVVP